MKNIDRQLQADATRIEVAVPSELSQRLSNAIAGVDRNTASDGASATRRVPLWGLQLAGSAGLVVALVVWLAFATNRPDHQPVIASASPTASYQYPVTQLSQVMHQQGAPEAELHNELQRLNADWQRIQSRVRNQIDPLL
ncbi:MAG: hypothetical protein HKO07_01610 [Pseudomonadales bacterium]|nr:hypothetical protein [Pseudomonadales bacterium]